MQKKNIIYYLLLLLPFIDVITALFTRNTNISITLGIIIKTLLLIYLIIYTTKTGSRYKKLSIGTIIFSILYVILYFILKPELFNKLYILKELQYIFKLVFFPICFTSLLCYADDHEWNKKGIYEILNYTLITYVLLLLIPILFGISYTSYPFKLKGYVGLFYSANEVGNILILLLPSAYNFMKKGKYGFLIIYPIFYTCLLMGTKAPLIGAIVVSVATFLYYLCKKHLREILITLSVAIFTICMSFNSYAVQNYKTINKKEYVAPVETIVVDEQNAEEVAEITEEIHKAYDASILLDKLKPLLSGRDTLLANTLSIYNNSDENWLLGIGYSNTDKVNNSNIERFIEIDVCDAYFHSGLLGLIMILFPFITCIILFIKKIKRINLTSIYYLTILGLLFASSTLGGHALMYPAVSIYIILIMIMLFDTYKCFRKERIDYNKVQILALHLKAGGVETVLTNQANMLAKKYDVEIVSIYNNHEEIPYDLNDRIKIIYLTDTISNRDVIKELLNKKDFIKLIPEVFKAIKILYIKNRVLKKFIINSNAGTIISTRCEFGKILASSHRTGVVTITEEHVYHKNNKKLIKGTIDNCKNIDYLLPTSKELVDFYAPLVKADVRYIKNVIKYYPKEVNKLNTKKLIAIGRLSKEKGFIDLIPIMKEVVKKDKNITLDIYGDGPEKENILNAIKKNKLEKNITIKGFVSYNKLNDLRKDYSLMIIPSYEESFGLAALESMAFGVPCIIYDDAKGLQEFVNNETGVIISNRDYKKFANSILELFGNKKELLRLGANSRTMSENYYFNKVQGEFIDFMKEAINNTNKPKIIRFFDSLYSGTKEDFYKIIYKNLKDNKKQFIITANPEAFMHGKRDTIVEKMLLDKKVSVVADGIGLVKTAKMVGIDIPERIPGVDISEELFKYGNELKKSVYLFGSKQEVLDLMVKKLNEDYPNLKVAGYQNGYVKDKDKVFEDIIKCKPDIVLVALGMPNQEKIIYKYLDKFDKGIFVGVGGSLDVLSGSKKRAPKIFVKLNIEWLYRILKEPKRLKRFYDNNIKFVFEIKKMRNGNNNEKN